MLDFNGLNQSLSHRTRELLTEWCPGGRINGREYEAATVRGGKGSSFKFNIDTHKFCDFATGQKGGDLISLYAAVQGISQGEAFKQLSNTYEGPRKSELPSLPPPAPKPTHRDIPPSDAPAASFTHQKFGEPVHVWTYEDTDGVLFHVARYEPPNSKKQYVPITWSNSTDNKWIHRAWTHDRPLYKLKQIRETPNKPILICEGEKAADAAQKIVGNIYITTTWSGGAQAWDKTDFTPIYGREILLWPDADEPGRKVMHKIAENLHNHATKIKIIQSEDRLNFKGWDAADAVDEGFTWNNFKEWAKPRAKKYPKDFSDQAVLDIGKQLIEIIEPEVMPANQEFMVAQPSNHSKPPRPALTGEVVSEMPSSIDPKKDSEAAIALTRHFSTNYLFHEVEKQWYKFTGRIWERIGESVFENELFSVINHSSKDPFTAKFFTSMKSLVRMRLTSDIKWNNTTEFIPLQNGVLRLSDMVLEKYTPSHMFNWILPYDYDPSAECPMFEELVSWLSSGNPQVEETLYAYLAAIIRGRYDLQKYLEIVGLPGTGKSTFLNLAMQLVGKENCAMSNLGLLGQREGKFETACFKDKRLVVFPDAKVWVDGADTFKSLTGGDPIRWEQKNNKNITNFVFKGMVMVASNHQLVFDDSSTAIVRRRIPVHIDAILDDSRKRPNYTQDLMAELPGIFCRLLLITNDDITNILSKTKETLKESQMRAIVETNVIAEWLNERCVLSENDEGVQVGQLKRKPSGEVDSDYAKEFLYSNFVEWCEGNGRVKNCHAQTFRRSVMELLKTLNIHHRFSYTNNKRKIHGIRLRKEYDSELSNLIY